MFRMKTAMAALYALILSIGLAMAPSPVEASLVDVDVTVGDIKTGPILSYNNVNVGAAANIASNICGIPVNVNVLSLQLQRTGSFRCENKQTLKFVQVNK